MLEIVPYRTEWPVEFQSIAAVMRRGLGDFALRIDHIGSTAVPGLAAKDRIDVQITVAALADPVVTAMVGLGYRHSEGIRGDHVPPGFEGPSDHWQKWFFGCPEGQRKTNTHVRVAGCANQRYPLLFRDYLRSRPASADAYAELKRRLARELADPDTYPDVKDPAVDLIYLAAEDWAAFTGWEPGPPDA